MKRFVHTVASNAASCKPLQLWFRVGRFARQLASISEEHRMAGSHLNSAAANEVTRLSLAECSVAGLRIVWPAAERATGRAARCMPLAQQSATLCRLWAEPVVLLWVGSEVAGAHSPRRLSVSRPSSDVASPAK